ncbi:hypothetical protein VTN00DRAFT_6323 [Thermoascus crustaceus]|uniref:uncharacterized protein n=1 Tax=Thermoascus crustaceus TaxID=5088 RepID=UPI0037438CF8
MEALLWRVNPREPIPPHIARFITPVFLSVAILSVLPLPGLTRTAVGLSVYNIVALCTNTLDCSSSFLHGCDFSGSPSRRYGWGFVRGVNFIYLEAY